MNLWKAKDCQKINWKKYIFQSNKGNIKKINKGEINSIFPVLFQCEEAAELLKSKKKLCGENTCSFPNLVWIKKWAIFPGKFLFRNSTRNKNTALANIHKDIGIISLGGNSNALWEM